MKTFRNPKYVEEIFSRSQKLTPQTPRCWGRMSAHQMLCHLNDAFRLYTGEIAAAPLGFPYPSRLLKWSCLWVPVTWPQGFRTAPEVDQEQGGTRPVEFEKDAAEFRLLLSRFSGLAEDFAWPTHPYLGRMSYVEYMRLCYLHTDHHFRQFGV